MSISVTTDIFCDNCNCWEHGTTGMRVLATVARREVKSKGWVRYWNGTNMSDCCPGCREELGL